MPFKMCHNKPIFILKANQDWPSWNLDVVQNLKKRGLTHLLKDKNQPASETGLSTWNREQKTACAIIISRLGPSIAKAMNRHRTVETLLQAIDDFTKPTGEEALQILCDLWTRLSTLSSSRHDSISDYCSAAEDIQTQYQRLGCPISDAVLSCAFLSGLPVEWQDWKDQQTHKRSVLVPWSDVESSTFTFSNLMLDALDEEKRSYKASLRAEEIKWGMKIKDIEESYATVVIDFCTVCHGVFHRASACSRLHTQLKRGHRKGGVNKRRRADSRGGYTRTPSSGVRLGFGDDVFLFSS